MKILETSWHQGKIWEGDWWVRLGKYRCVWMNWWGHLCNDTWPETWTSYGVQENEDGGVMGGTESLDGDQE